MLLILMMALVVHVQSKETYLVGCNADGWKAYVMTEFFYILNGLVEDHGWKYIEPEYVAKPEHGVINDKILDLDIVALLFCETGIEMYYYLPIVQLRERGVVVSTFSDDLQMHNRYTMADTRYFLRNTDIFITTYGYLAKIWFSTVMDVSSSSFPAIFWSPHSASPEFNQQAFNKNPKRHIFLSGAAGSRAYPIRHWLYEIANASEYKNFFHIHQHPGYGKVAANQTLLYAMDMNIFHAGISTTSSYRYVVAKTFEVPATGSLLVINLDLKDQLAELGFIDMENYVGFYDYNPIPRLKWIQDPANFAKIDQIRRNGRQLVLNMHLSKHRSKAIHDRIIYGKNNFALVPPKKEDPCPLMEHMNVTTCIEWYEKEFKYHQNEFEETSRRRFNQTSRLKATSSISKYQEKLSEMLYLQARGLFLVIGIAVVLIIIMRKRKIQPTCSPTFLK